MITYYIVAIMLAIIIASFWEDRFDSEFVIIAGLVCVFWPFVAFLAAMVIVFGWPFALVFLIRKVIKRHKEY